MAKNAESRYQSALGLKADLETCLQQLNETGKIESFAIVGRIFASALSYQKNSTAEQPKSLHY